MVWPRHANAGPSLRVVSNSIELVLPPRRYPSWPALPELARAAVDRRDFDDAAQRLGRVADGSKDPELRAVARTRLARVYLEQGKPDAAIALLDPKDAGAFAARYREIRGDAFQAKGDAASARAEYDAVLADAGASQGIDREFVELKRAALPAASPAAAPGAAGK